MMFCRRVQAISPGPTADRVSDEDLFELSHGRTRRYRPDGLLFIYPIVAFALFLLLAREDVGGISLIREVKIRIVIGRPRNDERRTAPRQSEWSPLRRQSQSRDRADGERGDVVLHVVAEVVEAELVVRAVRNVGRVSSLFLDRSVSWLRKNRCRRTVRGQL